MCGCGRTRPDQVTSVQAAQDAADAQLALATLAAQAVREAETYTQSAQNAIGNANSE